MNKGFAKLHRKIQDNEIFYKPKTLQLFLYLILNAAHEPTNVFGVPLKRGQIIVGRKALANRLRQHESSISRSIQYLKKRTMIEAEPNTNYTLLTIINYDTYNDVKIKPNKNRTPSRTTTEQRPNTIEELKELKEVKNKDPKRFPFLENKDFYENFQNFLLNRKAEPTELAITKLLNVLHKETIETAGEMVDQSIVNNWKGIFPVSGKNNKPDNNHREQKRSREYAERIEL